MSTILAIIACPQRVAQGQLAAEALRKAATQAGHQISIEIRNAQGVQGLLDGGYIAGADAAIVIAEGDADLARLGGKAAHSSSLEAVLADAAAVIGKALGAHAPATTLRIVAITSCPTGIAHTFMAAEGLTQARSSWATRSRSRPRARSARKTRSPPATSPMPIW
ncbi:hypothetical protein ACFSQE_09450 [Vogesella fluminis]|uniref:hypothetical protein n=1 Tax=Vogesella fluminis TaxID=1069161 RepID=UPI00363C7D2D